VRVIVSVSCLLEKSTFASHDVGGCVCGRDGGGDGRVAVSEGLHEEIAHVCLCVCAWPLSRNYMPSIGGDLCGGGGGASVCRA
jgi:hypothetical protein